MAEHRPSRRRCLRAIGAAALTTWASGTPVTHAVGRASSLSTDDLVRVLGRSDGGVSVRWTDGVLTAHVDSKTTPCFRVLSQIFSRHRRRTDGGFDTVVFELAYFTDLERRELLETWRNPFTAVTVTVPKTVLGPTPYRITAEQRVERETRFSGGVPFDHRFSVDASGDDLWVTESLDSIMPSPAPGVPGFGFHENFVYHTSADSLLDRSRPCVGARVQKINVLSWRPWMLMGDVRGLTMTRAHGRVIDDLAQLPDAFKRLNAAHSEGLLDDLESVLRIAD